jgi:dTDP-4-amino-4,6-dideoxygalactose transaminase
MLNTSFSPWPSFTTEEAEAVSNLLLSNKVNYRTSGEQGRAFEAEFAEWCGVRHALALANGTLALEMCLKALNIGPGDEVIVTPRTFLASASSILMVGAMPVFADVDQDSQNITPETASRVVSRRTRAIMCVHLAGWPCDMEGFAELARSHQLSLIEDCAQAHGATFNGKSVGSFGAMNAWSFCQDKIMTTAGEGGMVTTNSDELWDIGWSMRDHGKSRRAIESQDHPPGFRWLHESLGSNWRMLEIQSIVGRIQLGRMSEWQRLREENASTIMRAASTCPALRVPQIPNNVQHAWYKAYVFVRPDALKTGWTRDRIMGEIDAAGVPCYQGSCSEVYKEKLFDTAPGRPEKPMPVAARLGETSLMFLVHPTLTKSEVSKTADVLKHVMTLATR